MPARRSNPGEFGIGVTKNAGNNRGNFRMDFDAFSAVVVGCRAVLSRVLQRAKDLHEIFVRDARGEEVLAHHDVVVGDATERVAVGSRVRGAS